MARKNFSHMIDEAVVDALDQFVDAEGYKKRNMIEGALTLLIHAPPDFRQIVMRRDVPAIQEWIERGRPKTPAELAAELDAAAKRAIAARPGKQAGRRTG